MLSLVILTGCGWLNDESLVEVTARLEETLQSSRETAQVVGVSAAAGQGALLSARGGLALLDDDLPAAGAAGAGRAPN